MKLTSAIPALMALAAASALPAEAVKGEVIPFEIAESGHLIVSVTLNDLSQVDAILDTGATYPILDQRSARTVGIELSEAPLMIDIVGLGAVATFPVVDVDSMSFGDIRLNGMQAAYNSTFRFPSTGNVIPASSLPHRTLDFDFEKSRLLAYDRRPLGLARSVVSKMPISRLNGLPFVEVSVNGTDGVALIDTGASLSFVNSAFAEGAARSPGAIRTVELIGSTGAIQSVRILSSRRFEIGQFEVKRFDVIVSDPEFLTHYGLDDRPVMVLGLDILRSFRLQIDRERDQLRLAIPDRGFNRGPGMSLRAR